MNHRDELLGLIVAGVVIALIGVWLLIHFAN